jgi:hypothetical protein
MSDNGVWTDEDSDSEENDDEHDENGEDDDEDTAWVDDDLPFRPRRIVPAKWHN